METEIIVATMVIWVLAMMMTISLMMVDGNDGDDRFE